MKHCNKCNTTKPFSEFYKNKASLDLHRYCCKICDNQQNKSWKLKSSYGISMEQFYKLKSQQNEKCLICKNLLKNSIQINVDHCHVTGNVRGILCNNCNLLLGHAKDSIKILQSAQNYLKNILKKGA